jgi:hypothetical protein
MKEGRIMLNYEVFKKDSEPTDAEIRDFVGSDLLTDLDHHLRTHYKIKPKLAYSNCAMDNNLWRGWNIKYQKSGKSYCAIYPQQGYFLVLIPGSWFEVNNLAILDEVKRAIEMRKAEIEAKKKLK